MPTEGITYDRKALAAVTDSKPDWNALAKFVCVFPVFLLPSSSEYHAAAVTGKSVVRKTDTL